MTAMVPRPGKRGTTWTREEALEWYANAKAKKLARGDMAPVRFEEMLPYTGTFVALFGSIGEFQRAGGDEPAPQGRPRRVEP